LSNSSMVQGSSGLNESRPHGELQFEQQDERCVAHDGQDDGQDGDFFEIEFVTGVGANKGQKEDPDYQSQRGQVNSLYIENFSLKNLGHISQSTTFADSTSNAMLFRGRMSRLSGPNSREMRSYCEAIRKLAAITFAYNENLVIRNNYYSTAMFFSKHSIFF
jgi:hypothetical protein